MSLFVAGLVVLIVVCTLLHFYNRSVSNPVTDANFKRFQQIYLIVYMLAMCKYYWVFKRMISKINNWF